jgi:outer membrane protein
MKTTMKKVVLTVAAVACLTIAPAQKIAHLSFDSLISLMPETKTATEAAQNFFKGLEQESIAMQSELESKYKDYQEKEPGMSELVKKSQMDALTQLQTRIQEFQRQAEQEYRKKQAELTAPIFEKAKKGIEAVAKEGSYRYVLDTSIQNTSVLYSEASDDILGLVKKKLDSMPLAVIPGTAPTQKPLPPAGNKPPTQKPGQPK